MDGDKTDIDEPIAFDRTKSDGEVAGEVQANALQQNDHEEQPRLVPDDEAIDRASSSRKLAGGEDDLAAHYVGVEFLMVLDDVFPIRVGANPFEIA